MSCAADESAAPDQQATAAQSAEIDRGQKFLAACAAGDAWDKPAPPFRIYGEAYYVGTCGITAVLLAGDEGHILIDGGPRNGGPLVAANVEALGFEMTDVKILLHTHEHFDHVGGLADLQARSGAKVIASEVAAPVLASGETAMDDPQFGLHDGFAPVEVSATIRDGETVKLGALALTAIETPGHTPGALSWTWRACEGGACKTLVYMDSLTSISGDDYRFSDHPEYTARFRGALVRLQTIPCDIALTPHPAASAMFDRLASNVGLIDDAECRLYATDILALLDKRLEKEAR